MAAYDAAADLHEQLRCNVRAQGMTIGYIRIAYRYDFHGVGYPSMAEQGRTTAPFTKATIRMP